MAKDIDKIAARLGAKVVCRVPDVGGGAFGMARLAGIMAALQARLQPGRGQRSGRPTDANWVHHPKVPQQAKGTSKRTSKRGHASFPRKCPLFSPNWLITDHGILHSLDR